MKPAVNNRMDVFSADRNNSHADNVWFICQAKRLAKRDS
jgi:hypothetical protein